MSARLFIRAGTIPHAAAHAVSLTTQALHSVAQKMLLPLLMLPMFLPMPVPPPMQSLLIITRTGSIAISTDVNAVAAPVSSGIYIASVNAVSSWRCEVGS